MDFSDEELAKQIAVGMQRLERGEVPLIAIDYKGEKVIILSDALAGIPILTLGQVKELCGKQGQAN